MVNQSSANLIAQGAPVFPIQGNTLFLRMMMYIKRVFDAHVVVRIEGIGGINSGMLRDTGLHLGDEIVKGKWVCWEWELDNTAGAPAGDKGSVMAYLWRDGSALPLSITHDSLAWDPIPWRLLEVGLEAYQSDSHLADFWIDDIAVDSKKIGCPAK